VPNDEQKFSELAQDAGWHLFDLQLTNGTSSWIRHSEDQFRSVSFLDQRLLIPDPAREPATSSDRFHENVPINVVAEQLSKQASPTPHFIFHLGHCGSTLISRALAAAAILPLREPLTLRQLAAGQNDTAAGERWAGSLAITLQAHSRVFHSGQRAMIKATSSCNALIEPILGKLPTAKTALMYVSLEAYLAGMLGKQSPPQDLAGHAPARLQEWQRITGTIDPGSGISEMNQAQLAVLSWLSSMARLLQARSAFAEQCLLLDFGVFLENPETELEGLIDFFGLNDSRVEILQAWPEISTGYSKKPDEPYSAFNRNKTLSRGRMLRADDIRSGIAWAERLITQHPALQSCGEYLGAN
jgi:hypothetical protein